VSNVLRFVGKMLTDRPIDKERVFIICLYLSDDTIAVFEPPQRNSGTAILFKFRSEKKNMIKILPNLIPLFLYLRFDWG